MTADNRLRAVIYDMASIEAERANEYRPHEWTDDQIRQVFDGNAEIDRLTAPPAVDPAVARLTDLHRRTYKP
jgi:hypothetical protein